MATTENQPKAAPDKSAAEYQKEGQQAATKARTGKSDDASTARSSTSDVRARRTGNRDDNPFSGVADELRETHERRTTVPGAPGVDARLDNRVGDARPPLEQWPAKPQQIDGPDITEQLEHTRRVLRERDSSDDGTPRKGMSSPGPHGLGEEAGR